MASTWTEGEKEHRCYWCGKHLGTVRGAEFHPRARVRATFRRGEGYVATETERPEAMTIDDALLAIILRCGGCGEQAPVFTSETLRRHAIDFDKRLAHSEAEVIRIGRRNGGMGRSLETVKYIRRTRVSMMAMQILTAAEVMALRLELTTSWLETDCQDERRHRLAEIRQEMGEVAARARRLRTGR